MVKFRKLSLLDLRSLRENLLPIRNHKLLRKGIEKKYEKV